MQFSMLKFAVAALAVCSDAVLGQITPAQVVSNLKMITQKSQALQAPAQSITLINTPLIVIGQGPFPKIITGFVDIVSTGTTALAQMDGMDPVPAGQPSDAIFDAFREFVRVHQALLNILIGKAGILTNVPFVGQPVAAVLRQIEGVVDTLALSLIDNVESRSSDLQKQASSLGGTLDLCIQKYDGLSLNAKRSTLGSRSAAFREALRV